MRIELSSAETAAPRRPLPHRFINRTDRLGLTLGCQSPNSQKYDGRLTRSGERQMNVEIVIQRNARSVVASREIQNLRIFSPLQRDLTGVQSIPTCQPKQIRCARSQALVQ